jgi:flagellar motor switch protein FliG
MQADLTQRQKAAIIVRLLLDSDQMIGLSDLDEESQTLLAEEMAGMEVIDRQTRDAVINEFCDRLEAVGVTFPGSLDGTLSLLGEQISEDSANRLRRHSALSGRGDPWDRIATLAADHLLSLAQTESVEVVALMLSKLPPLRAAETFSGLPRDRARLVAQAISMTSTVTPQALHRVGMVLLKSADALPRPAMTKSAADRMGAILNLATADLREDVLSALDNHDAGFAGGVRKALFTFAHIPERIHRRDVPRIIREIEQPLLLQALFARSEADRATVEFIFSSLPQRMAEALREEQGDMPPPHKREIEAAMGEVIAAIRRLEAAEEITLILPYED